jgi:hypothetical protein
VEGNPVEAVIWVVAFVIVAALFLRHRRRRGRLSAGAAGAVYGMLSEDKQHAVEIVVEERAAARDPEDREGNLPELEQPKQLRDSSH